MFVVRLRQAALWSAVFWVFSHGQSKTNADLEGSIGNKWANEVKHSTWNAIAKQLGQKNLFVHHVVGLFYVNKDRQNVAFVRCGLVNCVMETEKMIRRSAALSEAGLRDMKDIMIL